MAKTLNLAIGKVVKTKDVKFKHLGSNHRLGQTMFKAAVEQAKALKLDESFSFVPGGNLTHRRSQIATLLRRNVPVKEGLRFSVRMLEDDNTRLCVSLIVDDGKAKPGPKPKKAKAAKKK